ncbi:MAG: hypothetical protein E2O80_02260 [Betaproteobacteria bacterium]|nr:MAG: hypothetical protein E2O80_02260 [Betaproteobacteria bacterium]
MKNKLNYLLVRFLTRSFRIAIGIAILILVFYSAANAREIATSSISFGSLSTAEILSCIFFSILAYLFFFLAWPVAFGKGTINLAKVKSKGKEIKKQVLGFMKMWMRG